MEYTDETHGLKHYLIAEMEKVLESIPHPFGTFEKAKYSMHTCKTTEVPIYVFTTTVHDTNECVNIMIDKFNILNRAEKYFTVIKEQDGIKEVVYTNRY